MLRTQRYLGRVDGVRIVVHVSIDLNIVGVLIGVVLLLRNLLRLFVVTGLAVGLGDTILQLSDGGLLELLAHDLFLAEPGVLGLA